MTPHFKSPWYAVQSTGLTSQLHKELGNGHVLAGRQVKAIANRRDCDDVLFEIDGFSHKYAIVHLTWRATPETDKALPDTFLIRDDNELKQIIEKDCEEWEETEKLPVNEASGFIGGKKRIIIIGASSGIGRALATTLALDGNLVAVTGRRRELLEELQKSFGGRIITSCFDITCDDNITHLDELVKRLGGLDLLIISAGVGEPSGELSLQIDRKTVATNVTGFTDIANWAFNFFARQGHGHLVTISSVAANRGNSFAPAYSASKSFQTIYFEGLSNKARRLNKKIIVTCIEPGWVKTKLATGPALFWVMPVEKAVRHILKAIDRKKRKVIISRRWWFVGKLMRWMPSFIWKRIG